MVSKTSKFIAIKPLTRCMQLAYLLVEDFVIFGGGVDKEHNCAESSISILVQSSWKFCLHSLQNIIVCMALLPTFCNHSWMVTSLPLNSVYLWKFTWCKLCDFVFYCSSPTVSIRNYAYWHIPQFLKLQTFPLISLCGQTEQYQQDFYIHGSVHCDSILIRSNEMQQYAGVYLLQNYSTCFGCLSHPSPGVHQTVTAASGTGHITCQGNNLPPTWLN